MENKIIKVLQERGQTSEDILYQSVYPSGDWMDFPQFFSELVSMKQQGTIKLWNAGYNHFVAKLS